MPEPAEVNYDAVVGSLSPENRQLWDTKGFAKAGEGGKPSLNAVFDSYRAAEKMIGGNNLAPPDMTKDDPFKDWEAGRKALGIHDDGTKYNLKRKDMPKLSSGKQLAYDEEGEKLFRTIVAGRVPEKYAQPMFDAMQDFFIARGMAADQLQVEDRTKTEDFLTKEWGGQRGTKLARAGIMADRIAEKLGLDPSELKSAVNEKTGSVGVLKLFDFLADQFGEGFIKDGGGGNDVNNENTPAGAKAALDKMNADKASQAALQNAQDPGHRAAVERREKLAKVAFGE